MGERIGNGVNEFGLWIPAFAGMTVMARLSGGAVQAAFRFGWLLDTDAPGGGDLGNDAHQPPALRRGRPAPGFF